MSAERCVVFCADCGLGYTAQAFADFVVSDATWAIIADDGANILCANCMVRRAAERGIRAEGRFTSGPFADDNWRKP